MKQVLVTGATGVIGTNLVKALLNKGYQVNVLIRENSDTSNLPIEKLNVFHGDIRQQSSLYKAIENCEVIFHLAALLHINNPSPDLLKEYEAINVQGVENIMNVASKLNVKRVIFFSSICVYGCSNYGETLNEESKLKGETFYAHTKISGEKIVLDYSNMDGNPLGTILRLAAVYGGSMKGNYNTLAKAIRRGLFLPLGKGVNRRTLIYIDDLCSAAIEAAENLQAAGEVYNLTDGNIYTLNEILKAIYSSHGKPFPKVYLPKKIIAFPINIINKAISTNSKVKLVNKLYEKYTEDIAVSGEKFMAEIDFQPSFSLNEGWNKIAERK